jgi:hypothetical protein
VANNQELLTQLQDWGTTQKVLPSPGVFNCDFYPSCQDSRKNRDLRRSKTCQMSYVGPTYASQKRKIVLVGMAHGEKRDALGQDFRVNQKGKEAWLRGKVSPHYLGIIRTAAALFGPLGRRCMDTCWVEGKCQYSGKSDSHLCVIRSIAQSNLAKCAAGGESGGCRATPKMYRNCSTHLLSELQILRPHVLVFHGAKLRVPFIHKARKTGWRIELVRKRRTPVLYHLTAPNFSCHVLFFHHPARNALNRQWAKVVRPALKALRLAGVTSVVDS